jgi:2-aminoadipate transaminase
MSNEIKKQSINFLRGVPAEETLVQLIPHASEGYKKAVQRYGTDVLQYGHFSGFKPLRTVLAKQYNVNPERIIAGNGGLEVISLFFKSLPLQSNIIIEEYSYDRVLLDAKRYGHNLIGVKLTEEGIDLNEFKNLIGKGNIKAFYGIPFHQNPSGINYTVENRKAVEKICQDNNIHCVWDICYKDLRYDGKLNSEVEVSEWGPILTSSFTKTISPGTKCGYMIVPENYVEYFTKIISNTRINPNLPTQAFIADFMESGEYEKFLTYLRKLYKPRMDILNSAVKNNFPESSKIKISGGFFATLILSNIAADKENAFIEGAKSEGVNISSAWNAVAPNFKDETQKKGLFIRLTFPAFQPDEIEWGITKLKEVAEKF